MRNLNLSSRELEKLHFVSNLKQSKLAFTMAEILLSLTIIGVVAAITLPSLIGNINEKAWNTQRKALHARMTQAITMMPQLNGYGTFVASAENAPKTDTAAMTFVTEGLSKVLKINNICDNEHLGDCGVASTYTKLSGATLNMASAKTLKGFNPLIANSDTSPDEVNKGVIFNYDTNAVAFETQNGETIIVYYNPFCQDNKIINTPAINNWAWDHAQQYMCVNFVFDLNGNRGPNQVGKDIGFISAIYANNPDVVAPNFLPAHGHDRNSYNYTQAKQICREMGEEYRLPSLSEAMAMTYNINLLGISSGLGFWSSFAAGPNHAWDVGTDFGNRAINPAGDVDAVRCVKR